MRYLAVLLFPLAIALGVRLYYVQVVDHPRMLNRAQNIYKTGRKTEGKRGEIFDRNGNLLVGNAPCEKIYVNPSLIKKSSDRHKSALLLATLLEGDYQTYFDKLAPKVPKKDSKGNLLKDANGNVLMRKMLEVLIARNVPIDIAYKIRNNLKIHNLKGFYFKEEYMRYYPKGSVLANILGFTNTREPSKENKESVVAVLGLERFFNKIMSAKSGVVMYERGRDGRLLEYGEQTTKNSQDGANIYLTIDEPIQDIVEQELDIAFEKWKPKAMYAVLADPKTGNVLAIAQRPTFDPNNRKKITFDSWKTRIIEDAMEPGSIIKPFSIAVALDENIVTKDTKIYCEKGRWIYKGKPLTDTHSYEEMSVEDIVKTSSNIGTAKIALMMGENLVYNAITRFGFGSKCGLPLKPESTGIVPPVKRWDGLSITRFPIGYAIMVSPVQMVRAYCALANGGFLPTLRLVDRVEDPETGILHDTPIEEQVQMFKNPATAKGIVDMMMRVTKQGGTARRAAIPGFNVAGKTGTSRKYIPGVGYSRKYFGSFVGFVPAENPAFVLLITMDEPTGSGYGGVVAAPSFKKISEQVLKYMRIMPDLNLMTETERKKYIKENPEAVPVAQEVISAEPVWQQ